jgi:ketosteroid isomerase-like protein
VTDHAALLTAMFDAFNRKDFAAAGACLHPDTDWPDTLGEGRVHGAQAVQATWIDHRRHVEAQVSLLSCEPDGEDGVRARLYYVVRTPDGRLFSEETGYQLYRFRDGLIVRMDLD